MTPAPHKPDSGTVKLAIPCGCGILRMLPDGVKDGDTVTLVPCPRCGYAPTLLYDAERGGCILMGRA